MTDFGKWQRGNRMWHIRNPHPSGYTMCGTGVSGPRSEWPDSAIRCVKCQIKTDEMLDAARALLTTYADVTLCIRQDLIFECTACGAFVDRKRPPLDGEGVFCSRPACKREQNRRNMAASRAKRKASA